MDYRRRAPGILTGQTKRRAHMMKPKLNRLLTGVLLFLFLAVPAEATRQLIPVGRVVGLELHNNTVTVAALEENSPAAAAGVKPGDRLLSIDRRPITCTADVRTALDRSHGTVTVTLQRCDTLQTLQIDPAITENGPKLGLYLRQGITGIGTVTYYDPETCQFGALGHGVNTPDGQLLQLTEGLAYPAGISRIRQGTPGEPGQLMGSLTGSAPIGTIRRNTPQGIFGTADLPFPGTQLPLGTPTPGPAVILSTVQGDTPTQYTVEILKVYSENRHAGRNLLLQITDPTLLQTTGGIVQGMSGSPIIQNGHLVGAVTHVLVNDPTRGYGIFIENMLDAAA